jgi:hypothetical protein
MNDDYLLILGCYVINWATLGLIIYYSSQKKQSLIIHLGIQVTYSLFWWYDLRYNSSGGTALVSWFFWMIFIGIHWLAYLIQLGIIIWYRTRQMK